LFAPRLIRRALAHCCVAGKTPHAVTRGSTGAPPLVGKRRAGHLRASGVIAAWVLARPVLMRGSTGSPRAADEAHRDNSDPLAAGGATCLQSD